jgi:hypothetical protein
MRAPVLIVLCRIAAEKSKIMPLSIWGSTIRDLRRAGIKTGPLVLGMHVARFGLEIGAYSRECADDNFDRLQNRILFAAIY